MIINTGLRTDIPAFYPEWLENRVKEGFALTRNPYDPSKITRYKLTPDVVDVIGFCTKNPAPFLPKMPIIKPFAQYWFVTITPYEKDVEPNVPDKKKVVESFKILSRIVGVNSIAWRYDPIFIDEKYTIERHISDFSEMAAELRGFTNTVVISFIDIYEKVKRNFPAARELDLSEKITIGKALINIAEKNKMTLKPCAEGDFLARYGADCGGCMTVETYEKALGKKLVVPKKKSARSGCACYLSCDIGAYNTCGHLCKYCYANASAAAVKRNMRLHDPNSPLLTGKISPTDVIREAEQKSFIEQQITLF